MTISKEDIGIIADLIVDKWQEQIILDSDAIPIIQQLKKDKIIGLVSNFDHPPHVRRYLSKYDMDALFDTIIITAEVGVKKPVSRIFDPALTETRVDASEVAYVGDTEEDIAAASTASMKPFLILRKEEGTDNNALDFSIEHKKQGCVGDVDASIISSLPELITML